MRVHDSVIQFDTLFESKPDVLGKLGILSLQKCTAVLRMLPYGIPADACDEYTRMGEQSGLKYMKRFFQAIVFFWEEYLWAPHNQDVKQLLACYAQRDFLGMFGSLDCMHWYWDCCPYGWQGQFTGKAGKPSIVLEAGALYDLWIWYFTLELQGQTMTSIL